MQLIRHLHDINLRDAHSAVTIGNFDGVHLGHQALILHLVSEAKKRNLESVIITFDPLPHEYFLKNKAPTRLSSLRDRISHFSSLGVDKVLLLRFNQALSNLSADQFTHQILVQGLNLKLIVVGNDFHYGKQREGNLETLKNQGKIWDFEVVCESVLNVHHKRVSSTSIRELLAESDLDSAARLLGHAYLIRGRVRHGHHQGSRLGFPTANVALPPGTPSLRGVYSIYVHLADGRKYRGVANIGTRPTFSEDSRQWQAEAHLFDFSENLYGQHICIEPLKKIREEKRFSNVDTLIHQIQQDIQTALNDFNL